MESPPPDATEMAGTPSADATAGPSAAQVLESAGTGGTPAAAQSEPELTARIDARLAELAGRPVGEHAEIYAAVHTDLQRALERITELTR